MAGFVIISETCDKCGRESMFSVKETEKYERGEEVLAECPNCKATKLVRKK